MDIQKIFTKLRNAINDREDKLLIKAILSSSASSIFLNEFEHNLRNMQSIFVDNKFLKDNSIEEV